jgi:hypothetical protein
MSRSRKFPPRLAWATITLLSLGGCADTFVSPAETDDVTLFPHAVSCRADVRAGAVACRGLSSEPAPGLSLSSIVGGQGTYVLLESDNVSYASGVFQADITVTNLIAQPMGTPDGTTVTGIKVFFHSGPTVTSGTGTVTVANSDGTDTFTGAEQPYFEYNELLQTNDVSSAKTWQWSVPSSVETFEFSVYVSADIPTLLYLRYESPDDFLSNEPATSGATQLTLYNYGSGQSTEFAAVLGNAVTGTAYGFSLWLGAGTSSGQTGTWAAELLVEHEGVRTTLATHTFTVPYDMYFVEYAASVTGVPGGVVGDQIILRLTLNDVSRGAILFGESPVDSHVRVPGMVTVSRVASPVSALESDVNVEVTAVEGVRYPGR